MTAGVVAAGHEATAGAAVEVLEAGGNAFDAVVAAGFAAAVCEPGFTSLGGGGFLAAHTAAGDDVVFDFFVDTPGQGLTAGERLPHFVEVTVAFPNAVQSFHCGLGSVAVPGVLAGYLHAHRRLGRLPLARVVSPAQRLADTGVTVSPIQADVLAMLEPIMTLTDEARAIYAPGGSLLRAGDTMRNPDLAAFLSRLDGFAPAGLVSADDLAAYRVVERAPLRVEYRGSTILTNPPPAFGGALLAEALRRLESTDPLSLAAVMVAVEAKRAAATKGTTHISVADADGNVAAMTTSNGEGSGYIASGTGVMLNNMLGEDDLHPSGFHAMAPGERVPSMMSPTIVLDQSGAPCLALGSGGSKRIRSAILQVLLGVLDHGLPVGAAVEASRIHWDGELLQVEPGFEAATLAALRERYATSEWTERNLYFGGVHAVVPGGEGAGDPRRGGVSFRAK